MSTDKRSPKLLAALLLLLLLASAPATASADTKLRLELEGGLAWQNRNDVQIPNDVTGTRFALDELVGRGPEPAARLQITWNAGERHSLRALLAPFALTETGVPEAPLQFAGSGFLAEVPVEATYRFNSWRLGYAYRFASGERWRWWIGFTAKLRDAEIRLEQEGRIAKDTDLGFVPLLHVAVEYVPGGRWGLRFEADALAGGPGRAEDAALKLSYRATERLAFLAGYRILEGGADVDSVYNFAWLNYVVLSVALDL